MALLLSLRRGLGAASGLRACTSGRPKAQYTPGRTVPGSAPSCAPGRTVPPCAPCHPAPVPECRARPGATRCVQRVVCYAAPAGMRPPCPTREPTGALTCRHVIDRKSESSHPRCGVPSRNKLSGCDCDQDPVARRLRLAKRARQQQYEQEVAARAAPPAPRVPPAPYRLGGDATDGSPYAVPHGAVAPRCGPGRTAPPPRCVQLAPDDGCRIKGDAHLDPCAHRPRVMIEIDRSANIVTKNAAPALAPSSKCGSGSEATRGERAAWCAAPPAPPTAPQRCRRPSIVERLRARSAPHLPDSRNERRLHTSVALSKAVSSVSGGLEGMISSKNLLKEAGLGRVLCVESARLSQPAGGALQLSVPPGTARVAVHVTLHAAPPAVASSTPAPPTAPSSTPVAPTAPSTTPACSQRSSSPCSHFASTSGKREPWKSIKKIQKKLTGTYDKGSTAGAACPDKAPAAKPPYSDRDGAAVPGAPPCGAATRGVPPGGAAAPGRSSSQPAHREAAAPPQCGGSPNKSKQDTKRNLSTTTFLGNTIVVSS